MEGEDTTTLVVDRLLHCLQRGIAPRVKAKSVICSPETSSLKVTAEKPVSEEQHPALADDFVTPDSRSLRANAIAKEVTPGVFYGSPVGKCSKRPPQVLRLLHEIRRDLASEGYSFSRNATWATFGKQDQALQFVESHASKDLALFVYQDHFSGQRRFLATTHEEFWCRYELIPHDHRHHYEIITEGSPCHLYFDLEFDRVPNSGLDGNVLVDLLLLQIAKLFNDVYSLEYNPSWVVELDSTTEEKFSRHLIIRVPNVAFKDNSHVGAFVAELCCRLDKQRIDEEELNSLYIMKGQVHKDRCSQLFLDQAVYSRNRSFRLPFSSKAGKTAIFIPSGRFEASKQSEEEVYEQSLICRIEADCEKFLMFGSERAGHGGLVEAASISVRGASSRSTHRAESCKSGKSPFPEVDSFIESISCVGGIPGMIRNWYWFSEYGVIVYNMDGNRFCENIGRQHKSNHVMYIVDFRTAGYYQKCHDPDCKGFKSPLRPIPLNTIPASFPMSLPLQAYHANAEENLAYLEHADCSAGFLSRLSIESGPELAVPNSFIFCPVSQGDDMIEGEPYIEASEQNQRGNIRDQAICVDMDDDWWISAQQELELHVLEKYGKHI